MLPQAMRSARVTSYQTNSVDNIIASLKVDKKTDKTDRELSITSADMTDVPGHKRIRWMAIYCLASSSSWAHARLFSSYAKSAFLPTAVTASSHLHEQLARGQAGQIYQDADPAFQTALLKEHNASFQPAYEESQGYVNIRDLQVERQFEFIRHLRYGGLPREMHERRRRRDTSVEYL